MALNASQTSDPLALDDAPVWRASRSRPKYPAETNADRPSASYRGVSSAPSPAPTVNILLPAPTIGLQDLHLGPVASHRPISPVVFPGGTMAATGGIGESPVHQPASTPGRTSASSESSGGGGPGGKRTKDGLKPLLGSIRDKLDSRPLCHTPLHGHLHASSLSLSSPNPSQAESSAQALARRDRSISLSGFTLKQSVRKSSISDPRLSNDPDHAFSPSRPPPPPQPSASASHAIFLHGGNHLLCSPHRLCSASVPDLRSKRQQQQSDRTTSKARSARQLAFEASTACNSFVYPQPRLKPFLITPPASPQLSRPMNLQVLRTVLDDCPAKQTSSTNDLMRWSSVLEKRPKSATPDEASGARVLREYQERENERVRWADLARKRSIATRSSGKSGHSRARSGTSSFSRSGRTVGEEDATSNKGGGVKSSLDQLFRPSPCLPVDASFSDKLRVTRKATSYGDLRGGAAGLGTPRHVRIAEAPIPMPRQQDLGNGYGSYSKSLAAHVDVVDISGWREPLYSSHSASPRSSSSSDGGQVVELSAAPSPKTRYQIGEAVSPAGFVAVPSSGGAYHGRHLSHSGASSSSTSSLKVYHQRFPPSPHASISTDLGSFEWHQTHYVARSESSIHFGPMASYAQGSRSRLSPLYTPLALEQSGWLASRSSSQGSTASGSSRRPASENKPPGAEMDTRIGWTFPPSPALLSSDRSTPVPHGETLLDSATSAPARLQRLEDGERNQRASPTSPTVGVPLFSYDNYQDLFYNSPISPPKAALAISATSTSVDVADFHRVTVEMVESSPTPFDQDSPAYALFEDCSPAESLEYQRDDDDDNDDAGRDSWTDTSFAREIFGDTSDVVSSAKASLRRNPSHRVNIGPSPPALEAGRLRNRKSYFGEIGDIAQSFPHPPTSAVGQPLSAAFVSASEGCGAALPAEATPESFRGPKGFLVPPSRPVTNRSESVATTTTMGNASFVTAQSEASWVSSFIDVNEEDRPP